MIDCSDTFLSKIRTSDEDIAAKAKSVSLSVNIESIINAMPCLVAVLDENRQIVFCNDLLLTLVDVNELESLLGKRPGEILECSHAEQCGTDCGTSLYCEYCGVAQAIKQCQESHEKVTRECRMLSQVLGSLEFSVTASFFSVDNRNYTLLSLLDISDSKRRASLERTFFHDICNSAGAVRTALSVVDQCGGVEELKHFATIASAASVSLVESIECQRTLLAAESHELSPVLEEHSVADIFKELNDIWTPYSMGFDVKLSFVREIDLITTDVTLIKRVIGNLIKNAIEASNADDCVTTSCFLSNENKTVISVNNSVQLPEAVLKQMFQRSFTTKGVGRGLGAYSVKLLTENYLDGTVSVVTDKVEGTTVFVTI